MVSSSEGDAFTEALGLRLSAQRRQSGPTFGRRDRPLAHVGHDVLGRADGLLESIDDVGGSANGVDLGEEPISCATRRTHSVSGLGVDSAQHDGDPSSFVHGLLPNAKKRFGWEATRSDERIRPHAVDRASSFIAEANLLVAPRNTRSAESAIWTGRRPRRSSEGRALPRSGRPRS